LILLDKMQFFCYTESVLKIQNEGGVSDALR
jgi:hypothetical protein